MRILQVMASGALGGGAVHLYGLTRSLVDRGHTVDAWVGDDGPLAERIEQLGVETRRLALMGSRFDPRSFFTLRSLAATSHADIVHLHGTRAACFGKGIAGLWPSRKSATIYTAHGLSFGAGRIVSRASGFWRPLAEKVALVGVDAVISVSASDLTTLAMLQTRPRWLAAHIPNAVDAQPFTQISREKARRTLGLSSTARIVGTVSRLVRQKHVALLIAAMATVPHATLVIVGDGPERESLEAQAAAMPGRVLFLGAQGRPEDIVPAFDLFALSSRWEGEPIALLEAMAAKVPWVATDTPGAREVHAAAPQAGRVVENHNARALGDALVELLDAPVRRREMGASGLEHVKARTFAQMADRTLDLYREALSRRRS